MRSLKMNPRPGTFDQIAIAFGELLLPRKDCELCDSTQLCEMSRHTAKYILFNPADYYPFIIHDLRAQKLIGITTGTNSSGIVGYLWGATIALDYSVPFGKVVVSSESRERILAMQPGFKEYSDSPHSILIDIWDVTLFHRDE